jgi:hypothetical protein
MRASWFYLLVFLLIILVCLCGTVLAGTAFVNVHLVPMTSETVIPSQTVLVKGSKIAAIGPSTRIKIPDNTRTIDGSHLYLLPGLADMHIHTDTRWLNGGWPVSPLHLFLASGVTTIRDFGPKGMPVDHALFWQKAIKQGRLQGPSIYAAGPIIYGPIKDVVNIVHVQKQQGFDFIKPYSFLSKKSFSDAVKTAAGLNMYVAGHIPFAVGLDGVLAAGMNEIAHIEELDFEFLEFDRTRTLGHAEWFRYILQKAGEQMGSLDNLTADALKHKYQAEITTIICKLKASDTPVCTTLTVDEILVEKLFHPDRLKSRQTSHFLPYGFFNTLEQGENRHQVQFRGYEDFAPFHFTLNQLLLRELHAGGVKLVLGTDSGSMDMGLVPGFSMHDELGIMIRNGLTPYEALKTATVNAARVANDMTGDGGFGTLEVGKRADMILVKGNPLKDFDHLKELEGVMASGRWYDSASLKKMITPEIPVTGAIKHVHEPDNNHAAYFDVIIGEAFTGKLPDQITSITIFGPDGKLAIEKQDFTYLPGTRNFWAKVPGIPKTGVYIFEAAKGGKKGSGTDILAEIITIPLPNITCFSPSSGSTLTSDTRLFSWRAVESEVPLYYRLEINKPYGGRVYSTGYIKDMQSHTVPGGVLQPGQAYRWRIRVTDNYDWKHIHNRSHSSWQMFYVR